ncbi:hypothetical protein TNIN_452151 [Trichonephila inaurata madagascariensis]|nr:hypothetical protein TNIN_452151 [Trichonephila inaurata madagascariensis]
MMLKLKPEEYMAYFDLVLAHILMHDAYGLGNPMKEGLTLEAGMSHNIFVNKARNLDTAYPEGEAKLTVAEDLKISTGTEVRE